MFRFFVRRSRTARLVAPVAILLTILGVSACGTGKITFVYPDEALDFPRQDLKMPAIYIDTVTDMRPPEQRRGQGQFFKITYPGDESWEVPATQIYAEALAKDLEQTHLVELVPLHSQADFVLSVDLLSLGCQLKRSPTSFLLTGALGAGVGLALGGDASHRTKLAVTLGVISMLAVPVPTKNHAEAEVRMILKDRTGNVVWQKSCLGEVDSKKFMTPTSRQDQELVNEFLTAAVKKANACLLGQLRQEFLDQAEAAAGD
jgi:hypothetical protein